MAAEVQQLTRELHALRAPTPSAGTSVGCQTACPPPDPKYLDYERQIEELRNSLALVQAQREDVQIQADELKRLLEAATQASATRDREVAELQAQAEMQARDFSDQARVLRERVAELQHLSVTDHAAEDQRRQDTAAAAEELRRQQAKEQAKVVAAKEQEEEEQRRRRRQQQHEEAEEQRIQQQQQQQQEEEQRQEQRRQREQLQVQQEQHAAAVLEADRARAEVQRLLELVHIRNSEIRRLQAVHESVLRKRDGELRRLQDSHRAVLATHDDEIQRYQNMCDSQEQLLQQRESELLLMQEQQELAIETRLSSGLGAPSTNVDCAALVQPVEEAFVAEMKALRQLAHVTDLIKVSTLDELRTRVEELKLAVDAGKERESILEFALSTAEKHVGPELAGKLGDSRKGRLAKVATKLSRQMGDLDQRAKGASLFNSARLKAMLPEAKKKQHAATLVREQVIKEHLAILASHLGACPTSR